MISWRSVLSVISCTLLYALFIREASRPEVAPQLSPPIAKSQSKVGQNDVSKRFYTGAMAPFTADHPLLNIRGIGKRDVCNDTFPGRYQQTCEPSRTLCCIVPGAKVPSCNAILGWGACCTEGGDCYVDVTSNCNAASSSCGNGVCCPEQTTCIQNFAYNSSRLARCSVNQNLRPGFSSSSSSISSATSTARSTSSSSTGTATTTTTSTSTGTLTPPPPANNGDGGLTAGAAAGIAVGSIAVAGLVGVAIFMLWRRRKNNKTKDAAENSPLQSQFVPPHNQYAHHQGPYTPTGHEQYVHYPPQEMPNEGQVHEAPNDDAYYIDQYGRRMPSKLTYAQNGVPVREMP